MPRGQKKISIIFAAKDAATRVIGRVRKAFSGLANSVRGIFGPGGLIAGGIAGIGGGLLARSFLDAARTTENYQVRLRVLLGSVEEGNRLFDAMATYAGKVPFELEEIMGSATQLAGILKGGVDEINQWMPLIGDLAAATGLGIRETTEQVSRMLSAGAASADLFRERGVLAMLGFQAGVSYSAEETKKRLLAAWAETGSKFKGATELMANTWDGLMSMFSDKWFQFRQLVNDSGAFATLKTTFKALLEVIQRAFDSGKAKQWAEAIGQGVISVARAMVTSIPRALMLILNGTELVAKSFFGWKVLWSELQYQFGGFMQFIWENLNRARNATTAFLEATNVGGVFDDQIANSKRIAAEQQVILGQIARDRKRALDDEQAAIKKQTQQTREFEGYRQKVGEVETAIGQLTKEITTQVKATVSGEKAKAEAIDYTTTAINRQIEAIRRAKAAAGGGGGTFSTSRSTASLDDAITTAERTE